MSFLTHNANYYYFIIFLSFLQKKVFVHKDSSVYNPTASSILERTNANICLSIFIYKAGIFLLIKNVIENQINESYRPYIGNNPQCPLDEKELKYIEIVHEKAF